MKIIELIKREFCAFSLLEIIFFIFVLFFITAISFILNDSKIALVSALCGTSYTILAGKGKVSCYLIGIIGTICYCYISFKNQFFGNLALYAFYYFPMEIIGIFRWLKHLKKDKQEIIKKRLSNKDRCLCVLFTIVLVIILNLILTFLNGKTPILDSVIVALSIIGQLLTVKRCIEQWYFWFLVNLLSLIMWCIAYIDGSNCFATILMWLIYLILTFYFLYQWQKELRNNC